LIVGLHAVLYQNAVDFPDFGLKTGMILLPVAEFLDKLSEPH
jgi:hypothetical protein